MLNNDRLHLQCLNCKFYFKHHQKNGCKLKRKCDVNFRCQSFQLKKNEGDIND